ncbi:hypothetical protein FQZ97_930350 [compost metagenome]
MCYRREVDLHRRLDGILQPARMRKHALDMLHHVVDAHQQHFVAPRDIHRGAVLVAAVAVFQQAVAEFLQRIALLLAQVLQLAQLDARVEQTFPAGKTAARVQQRTLPAVELACQRGAQF